MIFVANDNVLTPEAIQTMYRVHKSVEQLVGRNGDTWQDMCMQVTSIYYLNQGKYHFTSDLLFILFTFSYIADGKLKIALIVWSNPNKSNRRSAVHWNIPLWWVFCLNLKSVKERGHLNDLLAISSLQSKPSKLDLSSQSSPVMKVDLPNDSGVLKCFILMQLFFVGTATQQVILPQIGQGMEHFSRRR